MIQLNYRDTKPIYEQIKDGLRRLVTTNAIAPGEKLPSVRELASHLAINPNAIARAYRELENDGFLYTIPGKGTFVSTQGCLTDAVTERLLREFDEVVAKLLDRSVKPELLEERIVRLKEEAGI